MFQTSDTKGPKVLVVEDDPALRELMVTRLTIAGYEAYEARDGQEGLDRLADIRPHALIVDINMPRMDGFGFIEGMRADPHHKATPVLVLTTESDAAKKQRAREAGATGWIVKPFDPAKLVDAVRRVAA